METVKLGDVLEYEQPTKYIVDSVNYDDSFTIPVLTAGKSFILGYTDETTGVFDNLPVIIFDDFTTAFHYVDFPFKVKSSAMKILKPVKERADIKYLYYKMQTISIDNDLHKRYWISKYSQIQIPLPSLPQQQKIANILDATDALRQNDKALIAKYDELTQALFLDMFGDPVSNPKGWEKVEMKKLCSFKKKNIKPEDIEEGENYVALDSIEKVTGNITTVYNVEKGELKSNKFWFDNSYILYGKLRPYLNKVALPNFEGVCSTDIIPIQPITTKSNKLFITSILRHNSFVAFADERSSGANLPRISPTEVEKYSTINPPLDLQNQFAERVAVIEEQKAIAQKSLEYSESLFNSLLQKAFKGELV
ncbi:restriction endonuclease subunit S [Flavobacterium sp.]|uniref:restriction endonuclease subunit S n=1 Tax=Flavobacterium sp. TaxID=239 RepID=UPI0037BF47C3